MDSKYKLLASVDPTKNPVTVGKKFTKLAWIKPQGIDTEANMPNPTQRVLFPDAEDDEKSLLTDDESDNDANKTHCSELDAQMSQLGLRSPPKRDSGDSVVRSIERVKRGLRELGHATQENPINTQNMPSLFLNASNSSMHLSQEMREQGVKGELEDSQRTIVTISSEDNAKQDEESADEITPEVIILDDSDDDVPLKESIPIVSQLTERKSISSTQERRLNEFFDRIPSTSLSPHYSSNKLLVGESSEIFGSPPPVEHVELPETDDEAKSDSGIDKGEKDETHVGKKSDKSQTINISAKIRINIQIEEVSSSEDDAEDPADQHDDPDDGEKQETPKEEKQEERIELDKDMESILTEAYGDSWKTKKVLDSVKKKNENRTTNYNMFYRNIGCDLESTRFNTEERNSPKPTSSKKPPGEKSTKPQQTPRKKDPKVCEPKYKKYLEICDSESDYEGDGVSEDSWQMSSSEEESSSSFNDSSPVKRPPKKKPTRKNPRKRDEFEFTQNASSDSDNTFFENKPQAPDGAVALTPEDKIINVERNELPTTKRKLFSKKLYNLQSDFVADNENVKTPLKNDDLNEIISPLPAWAIPTKTPKVVNKKIEAVKKDAVGKSPKGKGRDVENRAPETVSPHFDQKYDRKCYGFLFSLNPTTPKPLCHPKALNFRDNYRQLKGDLTSELYNRYNEKIFGNQLNVPIKWNKKLLVTAGQCSNMKKNGVALSEIQLSEKVLTSADRLRCTLIHELCHAAAWTLDGERKGHAIHWKKWATLANKVFPELPQITVRHDYDIEYKYTYECVTCGAKTKMHSKSKKVENIRCKYCKGPIKIFLNKKNKNGEIVQTPVREVTGFAKFVKEKYKVFKTPQATHAETMKILSQEFTKINLK